MRKCVPIACLALLLCLATASPAVAAATEFGDGCVGNDTETGWTVIGEGNGGSPSILEPEAGPKELRGGPGAVITHWKVQVGPGIAPLPQQLLSFQRIGIREVRLLGESAVETLHEGTNEFPTRIPGAEYGLIGLRGPAGTLFCDQEEGHFLGLVEGEFPVGATRQVKTEMGRGVPAIATVERDEDGDGYGEETQDGCPNNPLFHTACPFVTFWLRSEVVPRGAVLATISINATATVHASAEVTIPRPQRKRKRPPPRVVPIDLGAQLVSANSPTTLRVPLPRGAIKRLAKMSDREKVKVKITATATDAPELEGRTMTRQLTVRIPGRARVHHPR